MTFDNINAALNYFYINKLKNIKYIHVRSQKNRNIVLHFLLLVFMLVLEQLQQLLIVM